MEDLYTPVETSVVAQLTQLLTRDDIIVASSAQWLLAQR